MGEHFLPSATLLFFICTPYFIIIDENRRIDKCERLIAMAMDRVPYQTAGEIEQKIEKVLEYFLSLGKIIFNHITATELWRKSILRPNFTNTKHILSYCHLFKNFQSSLIVWFCFYSISYFQQFIYVLAFFIRFLL